MKWKRPSGTEIETLDDDVTVAQCKAMGWKPVKVGKKITLYKRLKGEIIEGQDLPKEVIIESEEVQKSDVERKIKEGWFLSKKDAGEAPADSATSGAVTKQAPK